MTNNENQSTNHSEEKKNKRHYRSAGGDCGMLGGIYGMAFLGAAFYFIQHAESFWMGVLGFIKAIFWPAMLIYKLLEFLKI